MSKRILIAGGAGYIGCVLVPMLIERKHDVTVIDKLWFGNHIQQPWDGATVVEGDLFNLDKEDLSHFDTVIFLAGLSNDPMADYSPKLNFIENGAGPAYLAYMAKQGGVDRFIHGGSCSVYGDAKGTISNEADAPKSDFPYGISKLNGESAAMALEDEKFSVIGMRKGTVCGHSPRMRFDLIINRMLRDAATLGRITVNNPEIWRPIISVHDAARAYVAAVEAPDKLSGIFNIAGGNFQVGNIASTVKTVAEGWLEKPIKIETSHTADKRDYRVNTHLARRMLDFNAHHGLSDIVEGILAAWSSYGNVMQSKYYNIDTFRSVLEAPLPSESLGTKVAAE